MSRSDPLNKATQYSYNGLDQNTTITDPVGRVYRMGYDGTGTQRWTRTPDGHVTITQVDGLGRVITMITNYQDGAVAANEPTDRDLISRIGYDAGSRRTQTVDAVGRVTLFSYDNADRLISVTENAVTGACANRPCNVTTTYEYNRAGNRTKITDPRNNIRTFTYTAADEQKTAVDGLNRTTAWQYDVLGRRTFQDDPRGNDYDLTFQYDGMDRLRQTSATNANMLAAISAEYNGRGERTKLLDVTGSTTFQYDPLGRIRQVNALNTGQVGYTYNARSERTRLTYPGTNAPVVDYTYFDDGRLRQVLENSTPLATYAYDLNGRPAQLTRLNSGQAGLTNYQYDGADRIRAIRTTVSGSIVSDFQYQTDRLGLRTVITETLPLSPTISATRLKTISV